MISKLRVSHPEYILTSPFLLKTVHTGQQGRASGYGLGLPLSLMSPTRGTQAALFLKCAKCPPTLGVHTGLSSAFTALLLESLTRLPPVLGPALCSRSLQSDLPFRLCFSKQQPTDSPSLPFGPFYFSAHHCPALYTFFTLSVSSHQNTSSKSMETVRFCSLLGHQ